MTPLDHALALAQQGFHVFPLIERTKLPLIARYPERASRDPERIRRWWTCPVLGLTHGYNIGISATRYGDGLALLVVDIDVRGGKQGEQTLAGLDLPPTMRVKTPSGGQHLYYVVDAPVRQGANVLGPGVDIRSKGGFVVGPGSVTDEGEYQLA